MKKVLLSAIFLVSFCFVVPDVKASGASLYLSPNSGIFEVGSTFDVSILVNTGQKNINTIQADLKFDPKEIQVVNSAVKRSFVSLWTSPPSYSNANGLLNFQGGIPSPGINVSSGLISTITFRAIKPGETSIYFLDTAKILLDDGLGTNVLSSTRRGVYSITILSPEGPVIFSLTHLDQNKWYKDNNPVISWKKNDGVTDYSYGIDLDSQSIPDNKSEGDKNTVSLSDLGDGIWYFHLRVKNKYGWSKASHFKVQIDASPPNSFEIKVDDSDDKTNPSPSLYFEATDDLSGISHYDVKIDDDHISSVMPTEINPFIMPLQSPGLHKIIVTAIDKSGNGRDSTTTIDIKSIQVPEITVFPPIYNAGEEVMYIEGKSSPNVIIILDFRKDDKTVKTWEVTSDKDGNWIFSTEKLFREGIYKLSARAKDERGAISNPPQEKEIKILLSGVMICPMLITFWQLALLLALIIILFIIILFIILYRIRREKKAINKEVKEAEESLKTTFNSLRDKLEKRIETFDYRDGLSPREKKIRDDIFKVLGSSEKTVEKEIKDIEKEI